MKRVSSISAHSNHSPLHAYVCLHEYLATLGRLFFFFFLILYHVVPLPPPAEDLVLARRSAVGELGEFAALSHFRLHLSVMLTAEDLFSQLLAPATCCHASSMDSPSRAVIQDQLIPL